MSVIEQRPDLTDLAARGSEVFNARIRPLLQPEDDGKYVAIDVGTGDYELDLDDYSAVMRLRQRRPQAEIWLERAGQPTAYLMRRCP